MDRVSRDRSHPEVRCRRYRWYAYTTGHCYQMQEGYSFRWYTLKGRMIQGLAAAGALLALLVATLSDPYGFRGEPRPLDLV